MSTASQFTYRATDPRPFREFVVTVRPPRGPNYAVDVYARSFGDAAREARSLSPAGAIVVRVIDLDDAIRTVGLDTAEA